jgi:hypothetical protein
MGQWGGFSFTIFYIFAEHLVQKDGMVCLFLEAIAIKGQVL